VDERFPLDVDAEADISAAEAKNVLQSTIQNHRGPPTVSGSGAAAPKTLCRKANTRSRK
jgi:hypothetical protein